MAAKKEWITTHYVIVRYLRALDGRYLAFQVVASQPVLLPQEDPDYRDKFM